MIVFTNNDTKKTLVKSFIDDTDELKAYQRYYDRVFGKDKYTFWFAGSSQAKEFGCGY